MDLSKSSTTSKYETISEMKARKRRELMEQGDGPNVSVDDPYANAAIAEKLIKLQTGFAYDLVCLRHICEWDHRHPEDPERLSSILKRCRELGLENRCKRLSIMKNDNYDMIVTKHTSELYHKLNQISKLGERERETEAGKYDSIYFNNHTFDAACQSVNCCLAIIEEVAKGNIQNGIALCRPPGHHAMKNEYCGYCFFNNVAIAAEYCINEVLARKILIVDFDVHHGQGTQQMFYNRNDVLYFSIHRYEYGTFWPNLIESNFNFIGKGNGLGYNVNVPLNNTGLGDDDYLAIVFFLLLPLAYEYNPDLIIISAGYDAAIGCPEGKMNVSPGFYAHLITLLSGVAKGKICVCLEGGYFIPSLVEGVVLTVKALLGDSCPLLDPIKSVHPCVSEVITNIRSILSKYWKCFDVFLKVPIEENEINSHKILIKYYGEPLQAPFDTRNCYPFVKDNDKRYYNNIIDALKERYKTDILPVCYVYDEIMLKHTPQLNVQIPEVPQRLISIFEMFKRFGLDDRCKRLPIVIRNYSLYNPHTPDYMSKIRDSSLYIANDVYFNSFTKSAIDAAASGLLTIIDDIMEKKSQSGVAMIRPPGHHAEAERCLGFCIINNVAIGANYLLQHYNLERVLIVDFDIHHGNGTQKFFYNSKKVMYISVHRFDDGKYFPLCNIGDYTYHGEGCGEGYNINIPLNMDKMGDVDYLAIFHNLILPIAYSFNPEIVLVSAGFDAGIHDQLGSYTVSPELFGHFISFLKPLAGGNIVVALEGGYNITTTSYGMIMCTKALLGDPLPLPDNLSRDVSQNISKIIHKISDYFKQYWPILEVNKKLSMTSYLMTNNIHKRIDFRMISDSDYINRIITTGEDI